MAINFVDVFSSVREYVEIGWTHTPIVWDNTSYDVKDLTAWIRISIIPTVSEKACLGVDHQVRYGRIMVQIFTRYDVGDGLAIELLDYATSMLENKFIDNIVTYSSDTMMIGDATREMNRIESDWYQINTSVPFFAC